MGEGSAALPSLEHQKKTPGAIRAFSFSGLVVSVEPVGLLEADDRHFSLDRALVG